MLTAATAGGLMINVGGQASGYSLSTPHRTIEREYVSQGPISFPALGSVVMDEPAFINGVTSLM